MGIVLSQKKKKIVLQLYDTNKNCLISGSLVEFRLYRTLSPSLSRPPFSGFKTHTRFHGSSSSLSSDEFETLNLRFSLTLRRSIIRFGLLMRSIKQLPKTVVSSLRSSVVLFDLARVVEELIFNSIDAGATKVNVAINVGTTYVKVEDDGCGITRDGLVLLGEKYATSKLQSLAEMDTTTENFGFRGEALGSLSDVSLLEIITKARGWPNGYRKIIKGCKCLYLGIEDKKQDFGTAVIVRELFYNQPVRRKYMQSSPKKVLHSVKKGVLRVALVHPQISFKVTDIENGDELLCTIPSSSPLPLITSGFGTDVSGSLCGLNFSEGVFGLSGYLSAPLDTFPLRALQYVYINSRFVCKGPIHKLLNNLSANTECLDMLKDACGTQSWKRSRTQSYPAFILNLRCPRSSYDLTHEPSKTLVEFKDWVPVLSFIERAIRHFRRQIPPQGDPCIGEDKEVSGKDGTWKEDDNIISPIHDIFPADISVKSVVAKKKCKIQDNQTFVCRDLNFGFAEIPSEESDISLHQKHDKRLTRKSCRNTGNVKGQPPSTHNIHQNYCTFHDMTPTSSGALISTCVSSVSPKHDSLLWASNNDPFAVKDSFFSELTVRQDSEDNSNNDILGSKWVNDYVEVDAGITEGSTESQTIFDHFDYRNKVPFPSGFPKRLNKPFLRSCSSLGNAPRDNSLFGTYQEFGVQSDDFRTKCKKVPPDDMNKGLGADESDFFHNTSLEENGVASSLSSSFQWECHTEDALDDMSRDCFKVRSCDRVDFPEESNLPNDSLAQVWKRSSNDLSTNYESYSMSSYSVFDTTPCKLEAFTDEYSTEGNVGSRGCAISIGFINREGESGFLSCDNVLNSFTEEFHPASSCRDSELDYEYLFDSKRNFNRVPSYMIQTNDVMFQKFVSSKRLADGTDYLCLDSSTTDHSSATTFHIPPPLNHNKDGYPKDELGSKNCEQFHVPKGRSKRSHSAPPFYRGKSKFSTIYSCLTTTADEESNAEKVHHSATLPVTGGAKQSSQPLGVSRCFETNLSADSLFETRGYMEKMPYSTQDMNGIQKSESLRKSQLLQPSNADLVEDSKRSGIKWRNGNPRPTDGDKSQDLAEQNDILNISSGILHLTGGSVVPESISKDYLEDAKVLQQLDKKFIPVVAGATLAVIDQHAADERIRLEELREKVLYGEGKTVAYLDSEQELVLPEIGYQLLQNYAEQIQSWGWICSAHGQGSESFTKKLKLLHKQPSTFTLVAVPCILGVNLSDKDLLEFLEQLSETDGSSSMPPSVLRVLNYKACRGAIMFGDALLPSECSLLVEELKQTSLCFQCAHGRPTTVPLVNLEALHKQIAKLELWKECSDETWHGLRRHRPSLERAEHRLNLC